MLTSEAASNPGGVEAEGVWLCPRHLWDLATGPSGVTPWALAFHGGRLKAEIEQWRSLIRSPSGSWPMWWLRDRRTTRRALAQLVRHRHCSGCVAVATAERRELELVVTGLTDRPTRMAYYESHGLCLRHAQGQSDPAIREVLTARLGVLVWELDEDVRKSAWSSRHERRGDEMTAWLRAPVQIDGRAFLGAPAPVRDRMDTQGD